MMISKRKNDDVPLSIYDQTWLFQLYRGLRWERVKSIRLDLSETKCQFWIENVKKANYVFDVDKQMLDGQYEFQICVSANPPNTLEQGFVTGCLIPEPDEKTIIVLRAYPGNVT